VEWLRKLWALRYLIGCGCGLLLVISLIPLCLWANESLGPWLDKSWEEVVDPHTAGALEDTVDYFEADSYPYLPQDIQLSEQLHSMAEKFGYVDYDIKAMIAAAERFGIEWKYLPAIQMNLRIEGGYKDMFILSLTIAKSLVENGYHNLLVSKNDAIRELNPDGGDEWLSRVLETAKIWEGPLKTAEVHPLDPDSVTDEATIFAEMLRYRTQGYYSELVMVDGNPVILSDAETSPVPYPGKIEGFFTHPLPGSVITGYHFGDPVYNKDGDLIRAHHPGVDLGGTGEAQVYAAHDGTVVYAGWMNSGQLWISGIVVAIQGNYPDGQQVCTLYGHGKEGTLRVSQGQRVNAGTPLFKADNTGFSTGTHLHFDLRFGEGTYCEQSVDPMPYIQ
jgi:murein DD-endopeptidase MepM/ murein hydrolase activator NlpD